MATVTTHGGSEGNPVTNIGLADVLENKFGVDMEEGTKTSLNSNLRLQVESSFIPHTCPAQGASTGALHSPGGEGTTVVDTPGASGGSPIQAAISSGSEKPDEDGGWDEQTHPAQQTDAISGLSTPALDILNDVGAGVGNPFGPGQQGGIVIPRNADGDLITYDPGILIGDTPATGRRCWKYVQRSTTADVLGFSSFFMSISFKVGGTVAADASLKVSWSAVGFLIGQQPAVDSQGAYTGAVTGDPIVNHIVKCPGTDCTENDEIFTTAKLYVGLKFKLEGSVSPGGVLGSMLASAGASAEVSTIWRASVPIHHLYDRSAPMGGQP